VAYLIFVTASLLGVILGYTTTPTQSTLPGILEAIVPTLAHRLALNVVSYPGYALPHRLIALLGAVTSWLLGKHMRTLAARAWQDVITAINRDRPAEFQQSLEIR